jgi:hypothetical protein
MIPGFTAVVESYPQLNVRFIGPGTAIIEMACEKCGETWATRDGGESAQAFVDRHKIECSKLSRPARGA